MLDCHADLLIAIGTNRDRNNNDYVAYWAVWNDQIKSWIFVLATIFSKIYTLSNLSHFKTLLVSSPLLSPSHRFTSSFIFFYPIVYSLLIGSAHGIGRFVIGTKSRRFQKIAYFPLITFQKLFFLCDLIFDIYSFCSLFLYFLFHNFIFHFIFYM